MTWHVLGIALLLGVGLGLLTIGIALLLQKVGSDGGSFRGSDHPKLR